MNWVYAIDGLEQAVFSLSARLQRFLRKRYLEGQSCRAIAVSEDISEARVRTALHRLLKNLSRPENMDLIQNGLQIVLEKQKAAIAGIVDDPRAEKITLEQLNLTVRSYNLLKAAGLITVKNILESEQEGRLSAIRLLGEQGRKEVLAKAGAAMVKDGTAS